MKNKPHRFHWRGLLPLVAILAILGALVWLFFLGGWDVLMPLPR